MLRFRDPTIQIIGDTLNMLPNKEVVFIIKQRLH